MSKLFPGTKRHGLQECESCRRDFNSNENGWVCPHCGHDNKVDGFIGVWSHEQKIKREKIKNN